MSPAPTPERQSGASMIRRAWDLVAVPIISILLALVVGGVVILVSSLLVPNQPLDLGLPLRAYAALFSGSLGSFDGLVETCVQAAPLILAGLGVGLGFKAGLFNIGAQGQFIVGSLGAVWVGSSLGAGAGAIAIPLALAAGVVVGALWAAVAGYLKATSGAHEVVTTIMLNYTALAVLSWLATGPLHQAGSPQPVTRSVDAAALPILIGKDGHLGLLIALVAVPLVWFLLYRTTKGFEIRAVGANADAARYAGMHPRTLIVLTMAVAGGLAGLAGAISVQGISHQMPASFTTSVGFDAITVALLGRSNPWGILPAAILLGAMRAGAALMQIQAGVPAELVDVVQAIILLFLVANVVLRRIPGLRGASGGLGTSSMAGAPGGGETP